MAGKNLDVKETAVKEKRIWVRLTRRCNNGCLFCLDSDSHDGSALDDAAIEERIRSGREQDGQRLILSGGEPTIHPHFVEFVKLGRELGYNWIQTVTNGRMFAYRKFATAALRAGLNEATFSMHGHTPELHDFLVGVNGAFNQSLVGMRNLLGRAVVNVDVVLSKVNIPHLREILEFYMELGINEFDLLHMIPFGRAWNEHRETLFYDPAAMMPHLQSAFRLRNRPGIIIWTNRLPAAFLEGNEDLIQDPHKIHDEVRGRSEMFREWEVAGTEPMCRDDRCVHCPMERFCGALEAVIKGSQAVAPPPPHHLRVAALDTIGPGDLSAFVEARGEDAVVYLPLAPGLHQLLEEVTDEVLAHVRFYLQRHEYLSEAQEQDLSLADIRGLVRRFERPVEGLPPCLGGELDDGRDGVVPASLWQADGTLDQVAFTDWFIEHRYFVKSLRCNTCATNDECRGLHINTARNIGLGTLRPQRTRGRRGPGKRRG